MFRPDAMRGIIKASLLPLGLWSQAAEELLIMTAAHESHLGEYLRQIGGGPALGIYQMEPATEKDIWHNYLRYRLDLADSVTSTAGVSGPDTSHLQYNPVYGTIMARIKYLRVPESLPMDHDHWALACYAKDHFNTRLGKATPQMYYHAYRSLVLA